MGLLEGLTVGKIMNIKWAETPLTGKWVVEGQALWVRFVIIDCLSWYKEGKPVADIIDAKGMALKFMGTWPTWDPEAGVWECWVQIHAGNTRHLAKFAKRYPQWFNGAAADEVPLSHRVWLPKLPSGV